MKKLHIITIIISVLFMGSYAQAESSPSAEVKELNQTKNLTEQNQKTGFFLAGIRSEFTPADGFTYYNSPVSLRYGHYISKHSFFEAGIDLSIVYTPVTFHFKYGYDLIKLGERALSGIDIALLAGVGGNSYQKKLNRDGSYHDNIASLSIGFALGTYIHTFVSQSTALVFRVGAIHNSVFGAEDFAFPDTKMYINLSVKWYLY